MSRPEPPPEGSHYAAIGDFQGACYERNAFTTGTAGEVEFLVRALCLRPGERVLDVGCGTGRHARALAARGIDVVGVDVSAALLATAARRDPGRWVQADARALPLGGASVDAAFSLCQGGFGLTPAGDAATLAEIARVLRRGGRVGLTAFSLAFAARYLGPDDAIDVRRSLVHSTAQVRGPDGAQRAFDLWTACYTPGHLATLFDVAGLVLEGISGVEPGRYEDKPPELHDPELMAVGKKR